MSKNETPLTRWYWDQIGGLLIEEFPLVHRSVTNAPRYADAVIVLNEPKSICPTTHINLANKDIIVVQTKATRLGMYLMGQCLFSLELMRAHKPRSVRSVALCARDDSVLRPLLESFDGCEVVIAPAYIR